MKVCSKKIFFLLIASHLCLLNFGQLTSLNWARQFGGIGAESGYAIATDKNGNVYTTGYFSSVADFDPGPSTYTLQATGNKDVFVSKLNSAGNFVWAKKMGGISDDYGRSISVDSAGNVYVAGSFQNTVDFDPGPGSFTLSTNPYSNDDIFILKLNSSGNLVWAKQQGGSFVDLCYSLKLDNMGYLYNTGTFGSTADFDPGTGTFTLTSSGSDDIFISKLDTSGKFIWAKRIGGSSTDVCYALTLDKFGKPYFTGNFDGTVDFDPGPGVFNMTTPASSPNIFVLKMDTSGIFKWAKNMGGLGAETGRGICLDNFGGVYTSGYFGNTVDFDPGPSVSTLTCAGSWDAFVSKLDTNGVFRWARSFGDPGTQIAYAIKTDQSGDVYSTGTFGGTIDFDPGAGSYTLSAVSQDIFISKLDSTGNFIFAKQLRGGWDVNSMEVDSTKAIHLTGSFSNTTDFDPDLPTYTLSASGSFDIYVLKLGQCIIPPAPINTTTNSLVGCDPASFTLGASCPTGTVNWFSSPTSTLILGSGMSYTTPGLTAGNYTYYAEVSTCTTSISRTPISVTVNPIPVISITNSTICAGDSYTLSPTGAMTYTFSSGSAIVSPSITTTFSVSGTSSSGCITPSVTIVTISVNPIPIVSANSSASLICGPPYQGSVTLTGSGANTYTWSPGGIGNSIVVSPGVTTTYTVTGTDMNGCINTAIITQSVSACTGINSNVSERNEIRIYPNPNNGIFTVETHSDIDLSVSDVLGNEIYSRKLYKGKHEFSCIEIPSGLYFIKTSNKEMTQVVKLIKQ